MVYKIGSLFDGSGGFPLAGALCGMEPTWASEVEPYPIAVTRSRFPSMRHLGDISKINGAEVEPVDVITFGSPCQDLSVAGKRAGLKHEANGDEETTRSGLFMEAVRIIKEMREATNGEYPTFALWENVPGAFSSNKGEDFRVVLEELVKIVEPRAVMPAVPRRGWAYADSYIGDRWSLAYRVFDAQYWGVPQRRRRIHLVLDLRGERAREVLFEREGVRGYFTQGRTPWQGIASGAEGSTGANDSERKSGNDRGLDVIAYTMKERAGCAGGGKGPLVQTDQSATLQTSNDQYLFQPVGLIDSVGGQAERGWIGETAPTLKATHYKSPPLIAAAGFCTEHSAKSRGVGYQEEVAPTLRAGVTPAVLEMTHADEVIRECKGDKAPTLQARMGTGGNQVPLVMEPKADPVYCLQGNGIDRADTAGCNGKGWKEDTCYTLNTIDRPAVAYSLDEKMGQTYIWEEQANTLAARDYKQPQAVSFLASGKESVGTLMANAGTKLWSGNQEAFSGDYHIIENHPPQYIVRRLTPTECARLQGFADRWGDIDKIIDLSPEEYEFWLEVRNTHAAINGKQVKDYTEKQMLTWYNKLHTDSAEYKMWGNGIALPPALYCMQGIIEALEKDDDSWLL